MPKVRGLQRSPHTLAAPSETVNHLESLSETWCRAAAETGDESSIEPEV